MTERTTGLIAISQSEAAQEVIRRINEAVPPNAQPHDLAAVACLVAVNASSVHLGGLSFESRMAAVESFAFMMISSLVEIIINDGHFPASDRQALLMSAIEKAFIGTRELARTMDNPATIISARTPPKHEPEARKS